MDKDLKNAIEKVKTRMKNGIPVGLAIYTVAQESEKTDHPFTTRTIASKMGKMGGIKKNSQKNQKKKEEDRVKRAEYLKKLDEVCRKLPWNND